MGTTLTLSSSDGHAFSAYRADPSGTPRGGIVVVQEIFGVNYHIREVCDWYAAHGYTAIAPAVFDRAERDFERDYGPEAMGEGIAMVGKLKPANTLADITAAAAAVSSSGKVAIVGYCYGGTMAAAASINLAGTISAAISYYGGGTVNMVDQAPQTPLLCHYGERDTHIPMDQVTTIAAKWPMAIVHTYAADHGFNRHNSATYDDAAAKLAQDRSLAFLALTIG